MCLPWNSFHSCQDWLVQVDLMILPVYTLHKNIHDSVLEYVLTWFFYISKNFIISSKMFSCGNHLFKTCCHLWIIDFLKTGSLFLCCLFERQQDRVSCPLVHLPNTCSTFVMSGWSHESRTQYGSTSHTGQGFQYSGHPLFLQGWTLAGSWVWKWRGLESRHSSKASRSSSCWAKHLPHVWFLSVTLPLGCIFLLIAK